jgi:urease accessory protein
LKLLMPRNHGHAAWVYTASYGGGLVDRDAQSLTIDVGAGAAALISTQAATKVYRSPHGTSARLDARVADEGLLVVAPDPVVCFAGATYRQVQRIDLASTAGLVFVDWLSSGRRASGEHWAFDRYSSRTIVRSDGRLVFADGLELSASAADLRARMGRFEALAVVVLAGARISPWAGPLLEAVDQSPVVRRPESYLSIARLDHAGAGAVVRIAGESVEAVARRLREVLGFLPALLGDDPWARKW